MTNNVFQDKLLDSFFDLITEVALLKVKVEGLEQKLEYFTSFSAETEVEMPIPEPQAPSPSRKKEFYSKLSEKLSKELDSE